MRNMVMMNQPILFHKPNKKMRSKKKMNHFIIKPNILYISNCIVLVLYATRICSARASSDTISKYL